MKSKIFQVLKTGKFYFSLLFLVLILLGIVNLVRDPDSKLLTNLAPLLAAIFAGIIALSINETVSERRKADLDVTLRDQREATYQKLIKHLLQSFTGGSSLTESEVRQLISLWGSDDFLKAYQEWRDAIRGLSGSGGPVTIPPDRRAPMQEAIANVVLAARKDLAIDARKQPSIQQLAGLLFDDYDGRSR